MMRTQRAPHPKTRGGCITCKQRRVKCDETKPECNRCIKFWGACDGYPPPKDRKVRTAVIKPKLGTTIQEGATTQPLLPHKTPDFTETPHYTISKNRFHSQLEYRYFLIFRNDTVASLPSLFSRPLWEKVILQACEEEDFVRDAAVAIGALFSCGRKFFETQGADSEADVPTPSYCAALQYYGRALKRMRERLEVDHGDREKGLRMALIGCLLVVCFESLQGNFSQGMTHAVSGHKILRDWIAWRQQSHPVSHLLASRKDGITSPAEFVVESELTRAFARLDIQLMTLSDPRSADLHQVLKDEAGATIANMPAEFSNMLDAQLYWELIERRTSHFVRYYMSYPRRHKPCLPQWYLSAETGPNDRIVHIALPMDTARSSTISDGEYLAYLADIERWISAFNPLYNKISRNYDEVTWASTATLQLHVILARLNLLGSQTRSEMSLDAFLLQYREIVALAKRISTSLILDSSFDSDLIAPLRLVTKWCRDGTTRREAIELMRVRCEGGAVRWSDYGEFE